MIAFNPFFGEEKCELKVMTWNVHCSDGADNIRQKEIAELILEADADFVLLNEYNKKRCIIIDSLISEKFPFIDDCRSHRRSGDVFYSKYAMSNSGPVYNPIIGKPIPPCKASVAVDNDSVQIFGVHMESNHYNSNNVNKNGELEKNNKQIYALYKDAQTLRCYQAECIKKEIKKSKHPVIVMGDMNDFNMSKPLMILRSCGLKDSWWSGGNGYGATYHDGWMRLRIDHILHSDRLKLKSIRIIDTNLSDHNPLVVGFSFYN